MTANDSDPRARFTMIFETLGKIQGRPFAVCPTCGTNEVRLISAGPAFDSHEGKDAVIRLACGDGLQAGHLFAWRLVSNRGSVFIGPDVPDAP